MCLVPYATYSIMCSVLLCPFTVCNFVSLGYLPGIQRQAMLKKFAGMVDVCCLTDSPDVPYLNLSKFLDCLETLPGILRGPLLKMSGFR